MRTPSWFIDLDQVHSSYLVLAALATLVLTAGVLFQVGLIKGIFRVVGFVVRGGIGKGFRLWERLFSWAPWPLFLAIVLGSLGLGSVVAKTFPALTLLCSLPPLVMGLTACLAYMFIDLERYEVERGYKAVHNPLKGQALAPHLMRYGQQAGVPLLAAATAGLIGGFALLNQGLYETVGGGWYAVGDRGGGRAMSISWLTLCSTSFASWTCWTLPAHMSSSGSRTSARPRGRPPRC